MGPEGMELSWSRDKLLEILAVVCSFLYTFLYIKGLAICWLFAFLGAAIFVYLCYRKKLLAESALQLFYVAMAIYGYLNMDAEWQMNTWPVSKHFLLLGLGSAGMIATAILLKTYTKAELPWEDSFTSVFSIVATWVMVHYVHENYLYWIVIDAVSVYLYWKRKLYFGSLLFAVYTLMVTAGYFGWM